MRIVLLIAGLASAFLNCIYHIPILYIVSAVCLFLWFIIRGTDDPPAPGEFSVSTIALVFLIGGFFNMMETHTGAGEYAFYAIAAIVVCFLTFSKRN